MTCAKEMWEPIYMYHKIELDSSTSLSVGALLRSKQNDSIIWHPPFWDYDTAILYTIYWGCMQWCITIKVHGQSGSTVPRSPGSGILVPCGHGQIFMAAQVWHGMSQTLVPGHSFEQLAWQGQLEPVSSELPVLQVQQMWAACMVQVQVMQVVLLRSSG